MAAAVLKKSKFQSLRTILHYGLTLTLRHSELPQGQDLATPGVGSPQLCYFIISSNIRCPDQPHVLKQHFSKVSCIELFITVSESFLTEYIGRPWLGRTTEPRSSSPWTLRFPRKLLVTEVSREELIDRSLHTNVALIDILTDIKVRCTNEEFIKILVFT